MPTSKKILFGISATLVFIAAYFYLRPSTSVSVKNNPDSLSIAVLKQKEYPGSDIKIEETLSPEKKYFRYIASYYSDGLKIYALLMVPNTKQPKNGFPVIILNHGYIIPEKYTPDGNYVLYADAFANAGYIVFKPNFRGNGKSEGLPTSAYFSPDYTIDDLNAISSIKKYQYADSKNIGVWGHSMGGNIALKIAILSNDIKAVSIWSGVVGQINDIIYHWQGNVSYKPDAEDLKLRNQNLQFLIDKYGTPSENSDFWNSIDPISHLTNISAPIQIQVGLADTQVPVSFSKELYQKLNSLRKTVEYYEYPNANHDINQSFTEAMEKTIKFFDKYLK